MIDSISAWADAKFASEINYTISSDKEQNDKGAVNDFIEARHFSVEAFYITNA